jgi:hypothetical protein
MMRHPGTMNINFPHTSLPAGRKLHAILVMTRSGEEYVRVAGDAMDRSRELVSTNLGLDEEYHLIILQSGQTCAIAGHIGSSPAKTHEALLGEFLFATPQLCRPDLRPFAILPPTHEPSTHGPSPNKTPPWPPKR